MFIGHYGVSLAAKKYESRISLGILFFAVQFLDILFAILVLLNIEHMRIVPGFTKFNPYDLYYTTCPTVTAFWARCCGRCWLR